MTWSRLLTPDYKDALQEIVNVGMGSAGAGLAKVLNTFIQLSVPKISVVNTAEITSAFADTSWASKDICAVRQAFYPRLNGEVVVLFDAEGCNELADLLGHQHNGAGLSDAAEQELLLEISNTLAGACMNGVATQLKSQLYFSPPSIVSRRSSLKEVFVKHPSMYERALLIQVDFSLEARSFACQLLIFMTEESVGTLHTSLTAFLEGL